MEKTTIHLGAMSRHHPSPLTVSTIGWLPRKPASNRVAHPFNTCNFSFILAGRGSYATPDGTIDITAPCVITQWPDRPMDYAPGPWWSELFLIYPPSCAEALAGMRLAPVRRWWWPVAEEGWLKDGVAALFDLLRDADRADPDRVDRACERLLVDARRGAGRPTAACGADAAVEAVRAEIERRWSDNLDFDRLCTDHGVSPTHCRRRFRQRFDTTPHRYQQHLRLQRAARDLVEGDSTVAGIARRHGYDDPLYFSRCFRAFAGLAPSAYRHLHRQRAGLADA